MATSSGGKGKLAGLCSGDSDKPRNQTRVIHLNEQQEHRGYLNNRTSTTKYNILTFLPKALFEQYRRIANVYFTIVAALSLTPYSPVRAWTTFLPLGIVLGTSIIKEGIEDYKRYKSDKEVNNRLVEVRAGGWQVCICSGLRDLRHALCCVRPTEHGCCHGTCNHRFSFSRPCLLILRSAIARREVCCCAIGLGDSATCC